MNIKAGVLQRLNIARHSGPVHRNAMLLIHNVPDLVGCQLMFCIGVLQQKLIHIQNSKPDIIWIQTGNNLLSLHSCFLCFLVCPDYRSYGFGRKPGARFIRVLAVFCIRFIRVLAVFCIQFLCIRQLIEPLSNLRDQCMILPGGFLVCFLQSLRHLIIGHSHVRHIRTVFLICPGGIQDRRCPLTPDPGAELFNILQKGIPESDRSVAVFLQHHIIPEFIFQRFPRLRAGLAVRVQLLLEACPSPGILYHLSAGNLCQHCRHIVIICKTVPKHQDAHDGSSI